MIEIIPISYWEYPEYPVWGECQGRFNDRIVYQTRLAGTDYHIHFQSLYLFEEGPQLAMTGSGMSPGRPIVILIEYFPGPGDDDHIRRVLANWPAYILMEQL